ncbi:hypothetical protein M2138_001998 [Dysgonomonadaceae bacterium PH5-43]|nr:hypothetical protein [Dysgonomonadaceae bacterium PH5-43]
MDTDDLSENAYKGIIIEAEQFSHDLTLYYGMLSYECENEAEYLAKAEELTREIMSYDDIALEDLFFGETVDKKGLNIALGKILFNIQQLRKSK